MIAILWRFEVRPEWSAEFERACGPDGDWAALFRRAPAYLGTELYRGSGPSWLTLDRWRSEADFDAFIARHRADYEALDRATQGWTTEEVRLGLWEAAG